MVEEMARLLEQLGGGIIFLFTAAEKVKAAFGTCKCLLCLEELSKEYSPSCTMTTL
jgi:hypothetical protein